LRGWTVPRIAAATVAGLLGAYLVIRGIAEFFTVNFSDPASYRNTGVAPAWPVSSQCTADPASRC